MNFLNSLRSEFLKTRNTYVIPLTLILAASIPLIVYLDTFGNADAAKRFASDPWQQMFGQGIEMFIFLMMPMYVVLVATVIPQIEYRNNTWKQVLTSPQSRWNILAAKFTLLQILTVFFILSYIGLIVITAYVLELTDANFHFIDSSMAWKYVFGGTGRAYISILGLSALQFWFAIRFRSFLLPIGLGLGMWILTAVLFEYKSPAIDFFPYAFHILSVIKRMEPRWLEYQLMSVAWLTGVLGRTWLEFVNRKIKT